MLSEGGVDCPAMRTRPRSVSSASAWFVEVRLSVMLAATAPNVSPKVSLKVSWCEYPE